MNRRKALRQTALILGGGVIGAEYFLSSCSRDQKESILFTSENIALLDEVWETILPACEKSGGAKAAEVGMFMVKVVTNCYEARHQEIFVAGISKIDEISKEKYSKEFVGLSLEEKITILTPLDREAAVQAKETLPHFYSLMKQLILLGYFSSEIGVTQALRYNPVPGSYDGCVPLKKGDSAWYGPISSIA